MDPNNNQSDDNNNNNNDREQPRSPVSPGGGDGGGNSPAQQPAPDSMPTPKPRTKLNNQVATIGLDGEQVHQNHTNASSIASGGGVAGGPIQQHQHEQQQHHQQPLRCQTSCSATNESQMDGSLNSPGDAGAVSLVYYNREPLKLKDFSAEVRAPMDVEQFAHQAELLLDLNEISMENIIEAMLRKVIENEQISGVDKLREAREAIFIRGSSMLMARTIQGVSCGLELSGQTDRGSGDLKHDQSWLCALCNLAQIARRHMVIARFKNPINMGENAHEVRLFVLIVVPTQEKGTKREVETGRTFATMLTDAQFRQLLLRASNQTEFKTLMVAKAQQMARTNRLKNRHKYMLDAALNQSLSSITMDDIEAVTRNESPLSQLNLGGLARSPPMSVGNKISPSFFVNYQTDEGRDDVGKFCRNPRTSKLFELITPTSQQSIGACTDHNNQNNCCKQQQFQFDMDMDDDTVIRFESKKLGSGGQKLSGKMSSAEANGGGCCSLFGAACKQLEFGKGLWSDLKRRIRYYPSDFKDAFVGPPRTIQKTVATIWFLYFGILLPTIAFSSLNTTQTHGHMGDLRKAIIGQAVGGLGFALLGGQPLVIIMTTAPLCLYTKVIHQMCIDYGFHFPAMYAAVGLWNGFFLIIYSLFGFSKLMKWCTRSTEEIFALFIVVAFITDASKDLKKNFKRFYHTPACEAQNNQTASSLTGHNSGQDNMHYRNLSGLSSRELEDVVEGSSCRRETSLLFLLLMLGTLWLAVTLYKFRKTPYLSQGKRDLLADYALPTAVILMSYVGSFVFDDIYVERFPPLQEIHFERAQVELLPLSGILTSLGLGFTLSLLFFMDQNISAAMVNAPQNRLKKGCAYHYDLFVVGILNGFLAVYGLPMMHGVLPHSPLHVRSLADIEERVEEAHLSEVVVNCRETRITAIVSHVLVLASILLIPYPIAYIPRAVLNGLFLFMAITSLDGLQMFERILLLFTEQNKYPPNHYIRRCPQRKIHEFTILQLFQLAIMCLFGFSPINVVEMFFPVIILLMIPFRHKIVPKYIDEKYLDALDGKHN